MGGEKLFAGLLIAGALVAADGAKAVTVSLPADHTTLYLAGDIPAPFWVIFGLDAQIQLHPSGPGNPISYLILNITLSNPSGTTAVQFAEIEGAAVDNGLYDNDSIPRLLFSDTARVLHIHPNIAFFNAILLGATLNATLPDGINFTSDLPVGAPTLPETPLPAAFLLFATGLGSISIVIWRRWRTHKTA